MFIQILSLTKKTTFRLLVLLDRSSENNTEKYFPRNHYHSSSFHFSSMKRWYDSASRAEKYTIMKRKIKQSMFKTNASRNNSTASMRSTDCPAFMPSISHKEIKPQITKTNAGILKFISITHTAFVIVSYSA